MNRSMNHDIATYLLPRMSIGLRTTLKRIDMEMELSDFSVQVCERKRGGKTMKKNKKNKKRTSVNAEKTQKKRMEEKKIKTLKKRKEERKMAKTRNASLRRKEADMLKFELSRKEICVDCRKELDENNRYSDKKEYYCVDCYDKWIWDQNWLY